MIIGKRIVKLATELIPNAIFAVFTGRDDKIVGWIPIAGKYNSIMSFPGNLLVSRERRLYDQVLIATVENSIAIWGPDQTINGFTALNNLCS